MNVFLGCKAFPDKEVCLKREIIKKLREDMVSRLGRIPAQSQFIRGFVYCAETITDVPLPSHWYDEIIREVEVSPGV